MSMYREYIIDLYKNPINKGRVENETSSAKMSNPTCGDKIRISILANKQIIDAKFEGEGCAISQAAACILTEEIKGKTIEEAKEIDGKKMLELLQIEVAPMRLKCAMLCLETMKKALGDNK